MWTGRQRQRDRERAQALAEQTAQRRAARDNRLREIGLEVNDDNTVTGTAEGEAPQLRGARIQVAFDHFPVDNAALGTLQNAIDRLARQLEGDVVRVGQNMDGGWIDIRIGRDRNPPRSPAEVLSAQVKARATLASFLTPEQRRTYEAEKYFEVIGSLGTRYRIKTDGNASGNVIWRRPRKSLALPGADAYSDAGKYCAYPKGYAPDGRHMPVEDQFLGQMLQLITDENSYLDKANLFAGNYPTHHPNHARFARDYAMQGRLADIAPCDCTVCAKLMKTQQPRRGPVDMYYHQMIVGRGGRW
ncbi:MAG TPA: hypothetical protein VH084_28325 [Mycobacterium sp.]|nr:hypothetical protein [Mycobacterium sp.]